MTDKQRAIYDAYARATAGLTSYVVLKNGEMVARIVTRLTGQRSPNGLTMTAYVDVLGLPMVKARVGGGGYDMRTAAIAKACGLLQPVGNLDTVAVEDLQQWGARRAFRALRDQGYDIPHQLRALGYTVISGL